MRRFHRTTLTIAAVIVFLTVGSAAVSAQSVEDYVTAYNAYMVEQNAARDVMNVGRDLLAENQYEQAEERFREVLRRFPTDRYAAQTNYLLIRALVEMERVEEALEEVARFQGRFPDSSWLNDVLEERVRLTNELPRLAAFRAPRPPRAFQAPPAPPAPPAPGAPPAPPAPVVPQVTDRVRAVLAMSQAEQRELEAGLLEAEAMLRYGLEGALAGVQGIVAGGFQGLLDGEDVDPEVSLQQEIMRAVLAADPERAMEIAADRLERDPSDPVVLANFHMIARSDTEQALTMLQNIATNSESERARQEAIFWISRWDGDEERVVDVLLDILPSINDDETAASVVFSLSRVDSERAVTALETLASDVSRSEELRKNAVFHISRADVGNQVEALGRVYRSAPDNEEIRKQVAFSLSRADDEDAAVILLGEIARNDPSNEVRKQAVFFLGRIDSPEALQILESLLTGP